jgi:peptidoglycan/xylan/chitin deacetylase (PgdA/CDA1 family)
MTEVRALDPEPCPDCNGSAHKMRNGFAAVLHAETCPSLPALPPDRLLPAFVGAEITGETRRRPRWRSPSERLEQAAEVQRLLRGIDAQLGEDPVRWHVPTGRELYTTLPVAAAALGGPAPPDEAPDQSGDPGVLS